MTCIAAFCSGSTVVAWQTSLFVIFGVPVLSTVMCVCNTLTDAMTQASVYLSRLHESLLADCKHGRITNPRGC